MIDLDFQGHAIKVDFFHHHGWIFRPRDIWQVKMSSIASTELTTRIPGVTPFSRSIIRAKHDRHQRTGHEIEYSLYTVNCMLKGHLWMDLGRDSPFVVDGKIEFSTSLLIFFSDAIYNRWSRIYRRIISVDLLLDPSASKTCNLSECCQQPR